MLVSIVYENREESASDFLMSDFYHDNSQTEYT